MKKIALPYLEGFLFFSLLWIFSCGSEPDMQEDSPGSLAAYDLQVSVNSGRLRSAPGPEADPITELEKGTKLIDLGKVSHFTTSIRFGTETNDEPWLSVQTPDGKTGWIYGRDVIPLDPEADIMNYRRKKYLESLFTATSVSNLYDYKEQWDEAATAEAVSEVYLRGLSLRDSLAPQLEYKSHQYHEQSLPDLFWIDQYIPCYMPQLIAGNTVYYLFNDYRQWLGKAKNTKGAVDDRFFKLMIKCYPQDSIEYFTPVWEVPGSSFGAHNLLGRGLVYSILADIDQLQKQTTLFSAPLFHLKDEILAGITASNPHFWEADSLVTQELDSIIQANWSIFTASDRIALDARRMQLDSAAMHGIRFNARAGE
ncbi:MAG: SH3 domain-containing protein [Saprospiraceae bacterium]|nr:SH3 domain-containing protein [Lewinella sp.]